MPDKKILLAEDELLLRKSLEFFIQSNGFNIETVADGQAAVEKLRETNYDLVITDLNMPFVGGMEIINIVRNELHRDSPIIVLTSSGAEQVELESFNLGASEFIAKPFSPQVLLARIHKLLRN